MSDYHSELVVAARLLLEREAGQRGRLPQARIRRSISTAYYALFHFLLDDAARLIVGTHHPLQTRRRSFIRTFTHKAVLTSFNKVKGRTIDPSVDAFLRSGPAPATFRAPEFARGMATTFADAQAKRHDADYDLDAVLMAEDASQLIERVEQAIAGWRAADTQTDRWFKHGLFLLMALKGNLRQEG